MAKMDPRVYKTLRSIDDALLENLKDYPIQKITIEMLCKSALINRSTFYKYYVDKYALLDDYLSRTLVEFRNRVKADFVLAEPTHIDDPVYETLFREMADYLYTRREEYRVLWHAAIDRNIYGEMIEIVRDSILEKIAEKNENRDISPYQELYATFFASNMMSLIHWWFMHENQVTEDEVLRIMTRNMKKGLFYTFKQYIE